VLIMDDVHAVWVGSRLSLLEQLSIKLYQGLGHRVHLWVYGPCEDVPAGTLLRNAEDILPKSSIFRYQGEPVPGLVNKGIGSLGHWSERFQVRVLFEHGGIYTQLDVTPLGPLVLGDYAFVGTMNDFQTCFMKCPPKSDFARDAYERHVARINDATMTTIGWLDSMNALRDAAQASGLERCFLPVRSFQNGCEFDRITRPRGVRLIHWWNSALANRKDSPIPGSFYARLLASVGLWSHTLPAFSLGTVKRLVREEVNARRRNG
jgi:hypothetical protein